MNPEIQNALLIHNPNAGNGGRGRRSMLDEARRIFAARGIQTELEETKSRRRHRDRATRACGRASILLSLAGAMAQ